MVSISKYFFGELELFPEWFIHQVQRQIANLKDTYLPDVHVVSSAEGRLHSLLGDAVFLDDFRRHFALATQGLDKTIAVLQKLPNTANREALGNDWNQKLANAATDFEEVVSAGLRAFQKLDPNDRSSLTSTPFSGVDQSLADKGSQYSADLFGSGRQAFPGRSECVVPLYQPRNGPGGCALGFILQSYEVDTGVDHKAVSCAQP